MDRLTTYKTECNREMICRYEDCDICEEYCPISQEDNCSCLKEILEKLGQYEDAEEQGLLLRLPCKVGTEVWKIEKQFWIDRKGCKGCVYFGNDGLGEYCDYCEDDYPTCTKIVPSKFTMRMLDEFGKTVFLTREEAEQALESMKGGAE